MNYTDHYKGARNFALKFYKSKTWKSKSKAYRNEHPLCERCLAKGAYTPSQLVHHKIHIDESNYTDPNILYNDGNLQALCRDCHAEVHSNKPERASFNSDGSLNL